MKRLFISAILAFTCFAAAAAPAASQLPQVIKNPEAFKPDRIEKLLPPSYPYPTVQSSWEIGFLGGIVVLRKSTQDKSAWELNLGDTSRYRIKDVAPQYKVLAKVSESEAIFEGATPIEGEDIYAMITSGPFKGNYLRAGYISGRLISFSVAPKAYIYGSAKASKDQSLTYLIDRHPLFVLLAKRTIFCKSSGVTCSKI